MRIRLHGPLEEVAAVTPGQLVLQVTSVSEPYQDRKGTPRMWRVYLEGEIVATPPPASTGGTPPTPAPATGKPATATPPTPAAPAAPKGPLPSVMPLEIDGGGQGD